MNRVSHRHQMELVRINCHYNTEGVLTHLDLMQAVPKAVHHSRNQSSSHTPVKDEDHLQALHTHRRSHVAETGQLGGPWRQQPVSA